MADSALAQLACDEPTARRVTALVSETLPDEAVCSCYEADRGWIAEIHFRQPPDQSIVRALVAAAGADADALTFTSIAERDWVALSLAGLTPVTAGRFIVHGAHHRAQVAANAIGIEIEAALAFGTGHHGTTRGCLLVLDRLAKRHPKRPIAPPAMRRDKKILDLGTGSGVLAIAAARIFHARVLATDIDPVAVAAAKANARRNRAGAWVEAIRADGCRGLSSRPPFDLILANILLGPLMRMAAPLARSLAPGGRIVLSGLLPSQANAALAAYRAQGLMLERSFTLDNWVTLLLRRGAGRGRRK